MYTCMYVYTFNIYVIIIVFYVLIFLCVIARTAREGGRDEGMEGQ
jgi:hypothetical protein